ncbi:hypothetical protein FQN49_003080 [Arthroderma sp. PD_2]|nr:hypothetical protein FQN49_003080 [Arthroderma sp. PD_2]
MMCLKPSQLFVGRLGRYTLDSLAAPPVSHIWAANSNDGRRVILKFRKEETKDDFLMDREKENLKRFRSPYIRSLVDTPAEEHRGPPFLVLENMDVSIPDMWKARQEPPLREVITSLLRALKVIHAENYVHTGTIPFKLEVDRIWLMSDICILPLTDIEPRNILLSKVGSPDMEVKLADFENGNTRSYKDGYHNCNH